MLCAVAARKALLEGQSTLETNEPNYATIIIINMTSCLHASCPLGVAPSGGVLLCLHSATYWLQYECMSSHT